MERRSGLSAGKALVWNIGVSVAMGVTEVVVEGGKIVQQTATEKFPEGWQSFNVLEEFLEGSVSAAAGAFIFSLMYRRNCLKRGVEIDSNNENMIIVAGSLLGFGSMVAVGVLIHWLGEVPDVKWGPFK